MRATFTVTVNSTDADSDGLSTCGEEFYGTDPGVADTDGDGRTDGDEVAQGTDPRLADNLFEYAAKIVCGVQTDPTDMRITRGFYATAINVHNPNPTSIKLFEKSALTLPQEGQRPSAVMPIGTDKLESDEAFELDCMDIQQRLFSNGLPRPGYIKGFVVIQSGKSLDVRRSTPLPVWIRKGRPRSKAAYMLNKSTNEQQRS